MALTHDTSTPAIEVTNRILDQLSLDLVKELYIGQWAELETARGVYELGAALHPKFKVECLAHDMKLATTILNSTDGKIQLDFVVVVKDGADTSITEAEVRDYHKRLVDAVAAVPNSKPEDEVRSLLSDMFARAQIHMVKVGDRMTLGQFGHK